MKGWKKAMSQRKFFIIVRVEEETWEDQQKDGLTDENFNKDGESHWV